MLTYTNSAWSQTADIRFMYDGWNLIMELDGLNSNAILRKYTWGLDLSGTPQGAGGIGGLLAMQDMQGTASTADDKYYAYYYDANGNVGQLIDYTGAIAAKYEYDPYGNATLAYGDAVAANPFRFSTKYFDAETGMYYYGYRYYLPGLGRWASRDPKGEAGGENLYAFPDNSPSNRIDSLGLTPYQAPPLGSNSPCGAFLLCPRSDIVVPDGEARNKLAASGHNVNALVGFEVVYLRDGYKTLDDNGLNNINDRKKRYPDCNCQCSRNGNIRLVQVLQWSGWITGTGDSQIDDPVGGRGGANGRPPPGMKPPGRTGDGTSFVDAPYNPRTDSQSKADLESCAICTINGKETNLGCIRYSFNHGVKKNGTWTERGLTNESLQGVRRVNTGQYSGCYALQPSAPDEFFDGAIKRWASR